MSSFGATPKARAMRLRLPVTLPTSSCRSGPAARNHTAFGLSSNTAATSARSIGSRRISSSSAGKSSTKRRSRKRSKSAACVCVPTSVLSTMPMAAPVPALRWASLPSSPAAALRIENALCGRRIIEDFWPAAPGAARNCRRSWGRLRQACSPRNRGRTCIRRCRSWRRSRLAANSCRSIRSSGAIPARDHLLAHDPEKWKPVCRKDHAQTKC